jgi:hypothetical protein
MKIGFWNYDTPITLLGSLIWNICEALNISLDKLNPYIFGMMIGAIPHKIKKSK